MLKYEEIVDFNKVLMSYRVIMKNTKHKEKLIKYHLFLSSHLISVYQEL